MADFGVGAISIGPLGQVPADLIKIDPEFLRPLPGAPERGNRWAGIIGAAHA